MKFEIGIGKGKISVENDELHEALIDAWVLQLVAAWRAFSAAAPIGAAHFKNHGPCCGHDTTKASMKQKLAYYPTYPAKMDTRDLAGVRTYINQKLAPFSQDWNDRKAVVKAIRERFR